MGYIYNNDWFDNKNVLGLVWLKELYSFIVKKLLKKEKEYILRMRVVHSLNTRKSIVGKENSHSIFYYDFNRNKKYEDMEFKYFNFSEFDSPDEPGSGEKYMSRNFIEILDKARAYSNVPFKITSGYRTLKYHKKLKDKGYKTSIKSAHLKGLAVDIEIKDSSKRFKIINALMKFGVNRFGVGKNFIHVDVSKSKSEDVMWTYY